MMQDQVNASDQVQKTRLGKLSMDMLEARMKNRKNMDRYSEWFRIK